MPSALSESCMKFRLETLAPSGGWLASVAIGISLKSGIYEYTILAIIFMISFIILRTASCETAMVLALAYDLVIPFQYQNVQRHTAELEKYWPKFLLGCAIEAGCYLLCHPDLFNLAVIVKTSVLLIVWMKGKKQYPLNLAKDNQPPPPTERPSSSTRDPSRPSSSSSDVTPEYIDYVMKELAKVTGKDAVTQERANEHKENLRQKASSSSRQNSEQSLKNRKIMLFDDWKAAQGGGGRGGGSTQGQAPQTGAGGSTSGTQPPASTQPQTGNQPQAANHSQTQTSSAPPASKHQYTKPTDADIKQLKLDLDAKRSSFRSEQITVPLLAGPTHEKFPSTINYLRHKGISTRKWVAMEPANKTFYRVPDDIQDQYIGAIDGTITDKHKHTAYSMLRRGYPTMDALRAGLAKLKTFSGNTISVKIPADQEHRCKCDNCSPDGYIWYEYEAKLDKAREQGPEKVAQVEALYDYFCDPFNIADPTSNDPTEKQKATWYEANMKKWHALTRHMTVAENDYITGKAGIPYQEFIKYRKQLNALEDYPQNVVEAILRDIKHSPTAQEGRDLFKSILDQSQGTQGRIKVMKSFEGKTKEAMEYAKRVKAAEDRAAKRATEAAEVAASG